MAHQRGEIGGSLTLVVKWPQAYDAACPRDCTDFIIVQGDYSFIAFLDFSAPKL